MHLSISMEKLSLSLCFFNGKFANLRKPWINWALSLLKRSLVIFKTMPSNEVHRMFICPTSPTCLNVLCVYRVFGAQNGYSRQATVAVFSCFFLHSVLHSCTAIYFFIYFVDPKKKHLDSSSGLQRNSPVNYSRDHQWDVSGRIIGTLQRPHLGSMRKETPIFSLGSSIICFEMADEIDILESSWIYEEIYCTLHI